MWRRRTQRVRYKKGQRLVVSVFKHDVLPHCIAHASQLPLLSGDQMAEMLRCTGQLNAQVSTGWADQVMAAVYPNMTGEEESMTLSRIEPHHLTKAVQHCQTLFCQKDVEKRGSTWLEGRSRDVPVANEHQHTHSLKGLHVLLLIIPGTCTTSSIC